MRTFNFRCTYVATIMLAACDATQRNVTLYALVRPAAILADADRRLTQNDLSNTFV